MDGLDRRDFIRSVAGAAAFSVSELPAGSAGGGPVFLATWSHGKPAVDRAAQVFNGAGA